MSDFSKLKTVLDLSTKLREPVGKSKSYQTQSLLTPVQATGPETQSIAKRLSIDDLKVAGQFVAIITKW
jgi:hypothetical protein